MVDFFFSNFGNMFCVLLLFGCLGEFMLHLAKRTLRSFSKGRTKRTAIAFVGVANKRAHQKWMNKYRYNIFVVAIFCQTKSPSTIFFFLIESVFIRHIILLLTLSDQTGSKFIPPTACIWLQYKFQSHWVFTLQACNNLLPISLTPTDSKKSTQPKFAMQPEIG